MRSLPSSGEKPHAGEIAHRIAGCDRRAGRCFSDASGDANDGSGSSRTKNRTQGRSTARPITSTAPCTGPRAPRRLSAAVESVSGAAARTGRGSSLQGHARRVATSCRAVEVPDPPASRRASSPPPASLRPVIRRIRQAGAKAHTPDARRRPSGKKREANAVSLCTYYPGWKVPASRPDFLEKQHGQCHCSA